MISLTLSSTFFQWVSFFLPVHSCKVNDNCYYYNCQNTVVAAKCGSNIGQYCIYDCCQWVKCIQCCCICNCLTWKCYVEKILLILPHMQRYLLKMHHIRQNEKESDQCTSCNSSSFVELEILHHLQRLRDTSHKNGTDRKL